MNFKKYREQLFLNDGIVKSDVQLKDAIDCKLDNAVFSFCFYKASDTPPTKQTDLKKKTVLNFDAIRKKYANHVKPKKFAGLTLLYEKNVPIVDTDQAVALPRSLFKSPKKHNGRVSVTLFENGRAIVTGIVTEEQKNKYLDQAFKDVCAVHLNKLKMTKPVCVNTTITYYFSENSAEMCKMYETFYKNIKKNPLAVYEGELFPAVRMTFPRNKIYNDSKIKESDKITASIFSTNKLIFVGVRDEKDLEYVFNSVVSEHFNQKYCDVPKVLFF